MFYENYISSSKSKIDNKEFNSFKKTINSEIDENCLPFSTGRCVYNFDTSTGVLTDGLGVADVEFKYSTQLNRLRKKVKFPEQFQVMKCYYYPYYDSVAKMDFPMLVVYCSNRKFYFIPIQHPDEDVTEIPDLYFYEAPIAVTGKINGIDTIIFVSETDGMYIWNPMIIRKRIESVPSITSMCSQYGRIFAICKSMPLTVLYSDSFNPTNFNTADNEGGAIDVTDDFGNCNKVIAFKGYVYVFRDYNIAKITAYGDDDEFVLSQIYVSNGKIFPGTICVCGDKVIYLASDGLYSFDGNKSVKIDIGINNLLTNAENECSVANYSNGYYYLACRMDFNDGVIEGCEGLFYVNNSLIKLNLSNNEVSILRGYDIQEITVINDSIDSYVLVNYHNGEGLKVGMLDMSGKFFDSPTHKVWSSVKSDFNYPYENKLLKEITFESNTDGELTIWFDGNTKTYPFKGSDKCQSINPYIKGKKFSISFSTTSVGVKIVKPVVKVGVLC